MQHSQWVFYNSVGTGLCLFVAFAACYSGISLQLELKLFKPFSIRTKTVGLPETGTWRII